MNLSLDQSLEWPGSFDKAVKKAKSQARKLRAEDTQASFAYLCKAKGIQEPTPEFVFHPDRKWRWDYAWPEAKVALEVDGGVWNGGKHGRGSGISKDHEKRNAAAVLGWRLLLVQPKHLLRPQTIDMVAQALGSGR